MNLSHDNIFHILEFCSLGQLYLLFFKYKIWEKQIYYPPLLIVSQKIQSIKKRFPKIVIDLFGGMEKMISYPTIDWNPKFLGHTNAIDKVLSVDVTNPIMLGIDNQNRSFVTIRYKCIQHEKSLIFKNPQVITLFQFNSNDKFTWTQRSFGPSFIAQGYHTIQYGKMIDHKFENYIKELQAGKTLLIGNKSYLLL